MHALHRRLLARADSIGIAAQASAAAGDRSMAAARSGRADVERVRQPDAGNAHSAVASAGLYRPTGRL